VTCPPASSSRPFSIFLGTALLTSDGPHPANPTFHTFGLTPQPPPQRILFPLIFPPPQPPRLDATGFSFLSYPVCAKLSSPNKQTSLSPPPSHVVPMPPPLLSPHSTSALPKTETAVLCPSALWVSPPQTLPPPIVGAIPFSSSSTERSSRIQQMIAWFRKRSHTSPFRFSYLSLFFFPYMRTDTCPLLFRPKPLIESWPASADFQRSPFFLLHPI